MKRAARAFVADAMLGKLARWLRLLGAKTYYEKGSDDAVLKKAMRENAVLLTRDENLAAKARDYVKVKLFETNDLARQLKELEKEFGVKPGRLSFLVCPKCGGTIKRVPKKSVEGKVFPRVYAQQKLFWACIECGQTYWRGSHWKRIGERFKVVKNKREQ